MNLVDPRVHYEGKVVLAPEFNITYPTKEAENPISHRIFLLIPTAAFRCLALDSAD